jgi:hypothetical protein
VDEQQQFALVPHKKEERTGADVGALRDLAGRGAIETVLGEERAGGLADAAEVLEALPFPPADGRHGGLRHAQTRADVHRTCSNMSMLIFARISAGVNALLA